MLPKFAYARPKTLKEAVELLSSQNVALHAGGTDLLGCLREKIIVAEKVVSLSSIKDMYGIQRKSDGSLRIGAMTTITEIAEDPLIRREYPALAQAASEVASPQLRNQGTIGGNLCQKPRCWYYRGEFHCRRKGGALCYAATGENPYHCIFGGDRCYIVHPSDTAPALAALNATIRITGPSGGRTVPVEHFHVLPKHDVQKETILEADEIVAEIHLPAPPAGLRSSYRKVRARRAWDFALAGIALALRVSDGRVLNARVFLSGAAPVPWRSKEVETAISGQPLTEQIAREAADVAVQNAKPLTQNSYKLDLFRGMITEELLKIGGIQEG